MIPLLVGQLPERDHLDQAALNHRENMREDRVRFRFWRLCWRSSTTSTSDCSQNSLALDRNSSNLTSFLNEERVSLRLYIPETAETRSMSSRCKYSDMHLDNEKKLFKIRHEAMNLNDNMRTSKPSAADSPFSDIYFSIEIMAGNVFITVSRLSDLAAHLVSERECKAVFPLTMLCFFIFSSNKVCLCGDPSRYSPGACVIK